MKVGEGRGREAVRMIVRGRGEGREGKRVRERERD